VGATSRNAFNIVRISSERPIWTSSWTDPLSPKPFWLVFPAGEAAKAMQGELQSELRWCVTA